MKALVIILAGYCLTGIAVLAVLMWQNGSSLQRELTALPAAQAELAAAEQRQLTANQQFEELAERQRVERGGYDGIQAIRMSYDVQQAQDRLKECQAQTVAAQALHDKLLANIDHQQVRFVPLCALLLLHILGLIIFWPWRERRPVKRAR